MKEKLMLIDGNSILNRAFYGLIGPKMLSTSDGFYTNAIYGFLNILTRFINEEKPSHLLVAFDMKAPTFRHEQYEHYKAHRKGMPDELATQLPVMKEVLAAMNIKMLELAGYEADDIIGTMAKSAEKEGAEVIIVTGDRDSLQLASPAIRIKIPVTRMGKTNTEEYDDKGVAEKYGVVPAQMIEVKALMGDSSDNIPGVPGIGEKTAFELIKQFKSIDDIYANIDTIEIKERVRGLLKDNKELAYTSKMLGTIDINVPVDSAFCDCEIKEYNKPELFEILKRLEFNNLITKLGLSGQGGEVTEKKKLTVKNHIISDPFTLEMELNNIITISEIAIYPLIRRKSAVLYDTFGIALCWDKEHAIFVDMTNNKQDLKSKVNEFIANKSFEKYVLDSKEFYHVNKGVDSVDFDVVIAAYLLHPENESYNLDRLTQEILEVSIPEKKTLELWQKNGFEGVKIQEMADFACIYASAILRLVPELKNRINQNGLERLYYEIEIPLAKVLADMETEGFKVDAEALESLGVEMDKRINTLTSEIIELAGESFNINSTKQLGTILFEKLNLPTVKKTKTGYSTDVEVLEALADKHPIIDKIIEYRQNVKLKSTYIDGMKPLIEPETGRIHSCLNQTVTVTGRISSTEPNLQNIPVKTEMGKQIRKVFIAKEGCMLVDADYSQIELRVLAHISDDKNMIEAFKNKLDIHRSTAAKIFGVTEENVTPAMRASAKAINFGLLYGKGEFSLAKDLRISRKQAKEYIESYFAKFNMVHGYMREVVEKTKELGYVTTLLGRRRFLPEINSKNFNVRAASERMALNTPIQGTAADIIKIAMVKVHSELKDKGLKSKLILQVHDELIVEALNDEIAQVEEIVKTCMEGAYKLKVPMDVDMHIGRTWYEAK